MGTQFLRRAASDCFVRVAQPLADSDAHVAEARLRQPLAERLHAAVSSDEGEDLPAAAHLARDIKISSVKTDRDRVFVVHAQPGAEIAHGTEPRQHLHAACFQ